MGVAKTLSAAVLLSCFAVTSASLLRRTKEPKPTTALLHQDQAHSQKISWALKGTPTHYEPSGCKKVSKVYSKVKYPYGTSAMSIGRCFGYCAKQKGLSYFGVQDGTTCWCGKATDSAPTGKENCEKLCPGDPKETCGGILGTNVFVMFDCSNATAAEIKEDKAAKKKALLTSYGAWNKQTCGQSDKNVLRIDGKGTLAGKVDDCKIKCWEGRGAESCHGFTYDDALDICVFHYDVTAGPVKKTATASCYWKIPGSP